MKRNSRWLPIIGFLGLAAMVITGCQSVATTSAKLRNQEGNFDLALDLCRQALAENPMDAEAHFQMGFAYSKLDSMAEAYSAFSKAAELDPKKKKDAENNIQSNFAKHYKLGQSAYKRKDYATAATEFELARDANPEESRAYYNLGVAYGRLAENDSSKRQMAIDAYDKVLELSDPSDVTYVNALSGAGRELVRAGRAEDARERFSRLIEEDPTNYKMIEEIGNDLLNQQDWNGAAVFLKMAADARERIDSEDFTLYYNIGAALYNLRKDDPAALQEAITFYEKALDVQPDEPQTMFNIVAAHVSLENWTEASEWCERYVDVQSSDPKGWQMLARCYSELDEKDKAREAMKRASELRGGQ